MQGEAGPGGERSWEKRAWDAPEVRERACRHRLSAGGHRRNSDQAGARNSPLCRQLFLKPCHTPGAECQMRRDLRGLGSDQPGAREHPNPTGFCLRATPLVMGQASAARGQQEPLSRESCLRGGGRSAQLRLVHTGLSQD